MLLQRDDAELKGELHTLGFVLSSEIIIDTVEAEHTAEVRGAVLPAHRHLLLALAFIPVMTRG